MKIFNIAIEKGKRYLTKIENFTFIAPEFIFKKEDIKNGFYKIEYYYKDKLFYHQNMIINVNFKNIKHQNLHEDPLVESEFYYFISGQLTYEQIKKYNGEIKILFFNDEKLLREEVINVNDFKNKNNQWKSKLISKYEIVNSINMTLRLHMGKSDLSYTEKEIILEKNHIFNFKDLLTKYEYFALQYSYEINNIDVEEKHIFKGIKGIANSQYYKDKYLIYPIFDYKKYYSDLNNNKKSNLFLNTNDKKYIKITKIEDLVKYYNNNRKILIFEMNDAYIEKFYKKHMTSSVGEIYNNYQSKIYHIDSNVCKECNKRSQCMQLVPSGLSESLFKKNIYIDNNKNCDIYKIIEENYV